MVAAVFHEVNDLNSSTATDSGAARAHQTGTTTLKDAETPTRMTPVAAFKRLCCVPV